MENFLQTHNNRLFSSNNNTSNFKHLLILDEATPHRKPPTPKPPHYAGNPPHPTTPSHVGDPQQSSAPTTTNLQQIPTHPQQTTTHPPTGSKSQQKPNNPTKATETRRRRWPKSRLCERPRGSVQKDPSFLQLGQPPSDLNHNRSPARSKHHTLNVRSEVIMGEARLRSRCERERERGEIEIEREKKIISMA